MISYFFEFLNHSLDYIILSFIMAPWTSFLDRNLYFLVYLKGLLKGGFGKKYYSQWGEDIVVSSIFSGKKNGFYVDVGAYHPMHYSNTYLLYKRGWRGINIDPNPNALMLFKWHRQRDVNVLSGVSEKSGIKRYYIFNHQSCNTFSTEQKELMLKKSFIRLVKETSVECQPLHKILDKYASEKTIDFLNVDVEGLNLEVLRSIDWRKNMPRVVCVEDENGISSFMYSKSYKLHSKLGQSSIYISS